MRYYLFRDDLEYPNRWFLGSIILPPSPDLWALTGLGPVEQYLSAMQVHVSARPAAYFTTSSQPFTRWVSGYSSR